MIPFNLGPTVEDKLPFIANSNLFLKQKESSLFKKHERIHTELFSCTPCDKEFKGTSFLCVDKKIAKVALFVQLMAICVLLVNKKILC